MSESEHEQTHAAPAVTASAPAATHEPLWRRDIAQRLAHGATPHDIGVYVAQHVPTGEQADVWAFLHDKLGNAYVGQVVSASHQAAGGPLVGEMLVSNNPEGLSSPGTILSTQARAGKVAAYIHHSNHTRAPLDLFLVVKPKTGAPVTAKLAGASSATGDGKHAAGGNAAWSQDPNVVVAAAEVAHDAHDKHNQTHVTRVAHGATPIAIGTLPALHHGDPPLFDARYDLDLSGDAELDVVAEPSGHASAAGAAHEQRAAIGNTKYETGGTNGRAAGMYKGASFEADDTVSVSKLPFAKALTGSKFAHGAPSPALTGAGAEQIATPSADVLATAHAKIATSPDVAAVYLLEHVFRISADWLREKKAWNGSKLVPAGLTADYTGLISQLVGALSADRDDVTLTHTQKVIASHHAIGAGLDAASYGTRFELAFLVDNDTNAAAKVGMSFLTDAGAAHAHAQGAVYRGLVSVDGVDHVINHDSAGGHQASADLGAVAQLAPAETKYVRVEFQTPGQVSAGQELDIKKR